MSRTEHRTGDRSGDMTRWDWGQDRTEDMTGQDMTRQDKKQDMGQGTG